MGNSKFTDRLVITKPALWRDGLTDHKFNICILKNANAEIITRDIWSLSINNKGYDIPTI
jgi:hypothetical protein